MLSSIRSVLLAAARALNRLVLLFVHAWCNLLAGAGALLLLPVLSALERSRDERRTAARARLLLGVGGLERARLRIFGVAEVPDPVRALNSGSSASHSERPRPSSPEDSAEEAAKRAETWVRSRAASGLPNGAAVLGLLAIGLALVTSPLYGSPGEYLAHTVRLVIGVPVLLFSLWLVRGLAARDAETAEALLGPAKQHRLAARVQELLISRASVVEAIDAERRRIERDLHDGVQQQLVALALLLTRAQRAAAGSQGGASQAEAPPADASPAGAGGSGFPLVSLLGQAQENAMQALAELRDVAWRVYPAILDDRGLDAALSALAARSAVPVRIDYRLARRLPPVVEPVGYFAVSEAVTNAVKHSGADVIRVTALPAGDRAVITVTDNGVGGADTLGAGLAGLVRRVAAVEGEMKVVSPPGGPTEIIVELPCAW